MESSQSSGKVSPARPQSDWRRRRRIRSKFSESQPCAAADRPLGPDMPYRAAAHARRAGSHRFCPHIERAGMKAGIVGPCRTAFFWCPLWGGEPPVLPRRGRGTMRSMVEGYRPAEAAFDRWYPSTTFGGPPPRAGEDLKAAIGRMRHSVRVAQRPQRSQRGTAPSLRSLRLLRDSYLSRFRGHVRNRSPPDIMPPATNPARLPDRHPPPARRR